MVRAEPILSREVFDQLGAELADRENRKEPTKRSTGLLLRVIYCRRCGRPAYRLKVVRAGIRGYRCSSSRYKDPCGNASIPMEDADKFLTENFLDLLGDSERLERVSDAGSDHSAELAEINETFTDLAGLLGSGAYRSGTPQLSKLDQRITELAARQEQLSRETVRPAGWTWRGTGEQFSEWWGGQDTEARNIWLRSMNVRLTGRNHLARLSRGISKRCSWRGSKSSSDRGNHSLRSSQKLPVPGSSSPQRTRSSAVITVGSSGSTPSARMASRSSSSMQIRTQRRPARFHQLPRLTVKRVTTPKKTCTARSQSVRSPVEVPRTNAIPRTMRGSRGSVDDGVCGSGGVGLVLTVEGSFCSEERTSRRSCS